MSISNVTSVVLRLPLLFSYFVPISSLSSMSVISHVRLCTSTIMAVACRTPDERNGKIRKCVSLLACISECVYVTTKEMTLTYDFIYSTNWRWSAIPSTVVFLNNSICTQVAPMCSATKAYMSPADFLLP